MWGRNMVDQNDFPIVKYTHCKLFSRSETLKNMYIFMILPSDDGGCCGDDSSVGDGGGGNAGDDGAYDVGDDDGGADDGNGADGVGDGDGGGDNDNDGDDGDGAHGGDDGDDCDGNDDGGGDDRTVGDDGGGDDGGDGGGDGGVGDDGGGDDGDGVDAGLSKDENIFAKLNPRLGHDFFEPIPMGGITNRFFLDCQSLKNIDSSYTFNYFSALRFRHLQKLTFCSKNPRLEPKFWNRSLWGPSQNWTFFELFEI